MGSTFDIFKKSYGQILQSNKAINSIDDFMLKGVRNTVKEYRGGKKLIDAAVAGHTGSDALHTAGLIAGSYITASAAGRIATGGGLTKDRNGNTNIIGVPFI